MNRDIIRSIQFDPALSAGARNATQVCLRLQPDYLEAQLHAIKEMGIANYLSQQLKEDEK